RKLIQRQTPQINMAVNYIKTPRLFHRPAQVEPFTELPIVRRPSRSIGARQSSHQLAASLRSGRGKGSHLMPQPRPLPPQQPHQKFNAAAPVLLHRRAHRGNLCDSHWLLSQIEDDQPLVLQDARKLGAQVVVEALVVVEPPERGPSKGDEGRPLAAQPVEFPNCRCIIRWRAPVLPIFFQKRKRQTSRKPTWHFVIVHKDEFLAHRSNGRHLLGYRLNVVGPPTIHFKLFSFLLSNLGP